MIIEKESGKRKDNGKMLLNRILNNIDYKDAYGGMDKNIKDISIDSRKISKGSLFIAITGFEKDGHDFASGAARKGAVAVIAQKKLDLPEKITQIIVNDTRMALPVISSNFFDRPARKLILTGVTGTNGKTTTCFLINSILNSAGISSSMITTVASYLNGLSPCFERTTPESPDLNRFFMKSVEKGMRASCMEISSHSIDLYRVAHIDFDYFIFTNLSQDHLDYHKSMEDYFSVKERLFLKKFRPVFGGKKAIINMDDEYGRTLLGETDLESISYSIESNGSDVKASSIISSAEGISMYIETKKGAGFEINSSLCGNFNVYNILAAAALALSMNIDIKCIREGISSLGGVPGRFEKILTGGRPAVIVDYAHTPDGLKNVLRTARGIIPEGGRLISVFGCGGDRDRKKRKIMGEISGRMADFTILTSDNPRSEPPGSIIDMIEEGIPGHGVKKYLKIADRKEAIYRALKMACDRDLVLIAGKGHEDYQEIKGMKIPFSDQEIVRRWYGKK
ncbi:MAG: UDP-N-acetylmuramoyl-L-alanyl-D-glutamate--2,6-diaminopimelate ligase [Actinobacteria bacterium]|nr:UDP-N-acetylmuramoyl-L-alanyl-D-glutamate--2,6-diaminopimelate ligase [Actinomycetota bacterium]